MIPVPEFKKTKCPHCNELGIVFYAVNWDGKACWDCIMKFKVKNPTECGWSY